MRTPIRDDVSIALVPLRDFLDLVAREGSLTHLAIMGQRLVHDMERGLLSLTAALEAHLGKIEIEHEAPARYTSFGNINGVTPRGDGKAGGIGGKSKTAS